MNERILVVDDDAVFRKSLTFILEQAGYEVQSAPSGEEGMALALATQPDLVLQDVGLPGIDGHEVLRRMRKRFSDIPIIFLTARRRQADQIEGLELGADDFIVKPFEPEVLLARIRALLRRSGFARERKNKHVVVGDLTINPATRIVTVAGEELELPPRIFDLLLTLARRADEIVPIDEILTSVWGSDFGGEAQAVYVHVRWLREKIEADPNNPTRVVTVRGVGYRLVSQDSKPSAM